VALSKATGIPFSVLAQEDDEVIATYVQLFEDEAEEMREARHGR
jgi:hypothetical protein